MEALGWKMYPDQADGNQREASKRPTCLPARSSTCAACCTGAEPLEPCCTHRGPSGQGPPRDFPGNHAGTASVSQPAHTPPASAPQLAKMFSTMGRVLSMYRRPRTCEDGYSLLDSLEDILYYGWNKWVLSSIA